MGWGSRLRLYLHMSFTTLSLSFTVCKKAIGIYPEKLRWGFELAGRSQEHMTQDTAELTSGHDLGIIVGVLHNQDNTKAWPGGTLSCMHAKSLQFSSVPFSGSVISDSLTPYGL